MNAEFWHERWERKEIGFHEGEVNPFLFKWFDSLTLSPGDRVFIPLCGKTRDIAWLFEQGYSVVGVELSELAVQELFEELQLEPIITKGSNHTLYHYQHQNTAVTLDIYVGDVFDLTETQLGRVDAVYDRAALVALPEKTRMEYTRHIQHVTGRARQLLISYEYDQQLMPGPPFSISEQEIKQHYAACFDISRLERRDVAGGIKCQVAGEESVWLLRS
jgi:thiopurine S-methyltransferase